LIVRSAKPDDARLLWIWRNDPVTRFMFRTTREIPWQEHALWFEQALNGDERHILIGEEEGIPVGTVNIRRRGRDLGEVSISVAPEFRGRGFGKALLRAACSYASEKLRIRCLEAKIKQSNDHSIALFTGARFTYQGAQEGLLAYSIHLAIGEE
jgi:RimJ/RimL family protein N-acetyltransferase